MGLEKICPVCGESFSKKPTESLKNWETRRKYCSKACWNIRSPRVDKLCARCGSKFTVDFYQRDAARYCSRDCADTDPVRRAKTSERIKANPIPNSGSYLFRKGHEVPQEWRDAVSKAVIGKPPPNKMPDVFITCKTCGVIQKVKPCESSKKYCSKTCANKGQNQGRTTEAQRIRSSAVYREWRIAVFERDDYTCQECGQRGGELNADHIKPFALFPELRLDVSNGRTLCKPCHLSTETFGRGAIYRKAA